MARSSTPDLAGHAHASQHGRAEPFTTLNLRASFSADGLGKEVINAGQVSITLEQQLCDEVSSASGQSTQLWLVAVCLLLLRRYGAEAAISVPVLVGDLPARRVSLEVGSQTTFLDLVSAVDHALQSGLPASLDDPGFIICSGSTSAESTEGFRLCIELSPEPRLRLEWSGVAMALRLAEAALTHAKSLLKAAIASPAQACLTLPMLSEREYRELVAEFNDTRAPFPDTELLHHGLQRTALLQPDAVALVCNDERVSYGELNGRANRLAHYLRKKGTQAGEIVALCLERGVDMVVAVMAIEKSGAAYLPLEPTYPAARMGFMLEDSGAALVLTSERSRAAVPDYVETLVLDGVERPWEAESSEDPPDVTNSDQLAYVIYTSGSTGRPKGVAVKHQSAMNLIDWVNRTYRVGPSDRLLAVASVCFDLSVYDMFGILRAGGCLDIATEDHLADPEQLAHLLESRHITFWDSAPAALTQLVPFLRTGGEALRLVFLSGDWIPVPLPDQIRQRFGNAKIVALGGATEASVWSNYFEVGRVDPTWPSIPYGKPIRNARYYVLDELKQPLPRGVPGKLYIGGDCVAAGYFRREQLSRERFVVDPHVHRSDEAGARMYDTGDVACHALDGNLEFLGRADSQVKVRGYRVELGEIEAVLNQHGSVARSLCIARRDGGGHNTLYAYVIPRGDWDPEPLRAHLSQSLPDYMVPPHLLRIDEVPLTANGKVNHAALPVTDATNADEEMPVGEVETKLCEVFSQLIGIPRVGPNQNFFRAGGHSLLAVQLLSRIREGLGAEVKLNTLFAHPTPRALARQLSSSTEAALPAPVARDHQEGHALASAQERVWFIQQVEKDTPAYNVAEVFHFTGPVDAERLELALHEIQRRHSALRTAFSLKDGRPRAHVVERYAQLKQTDATHLDAHQLREATAEIARQPFDLSSGELLRAHLLKRSATEFVFCLVVHHIAIDGWSLRNLYAELSALYRTASDASVPSLPVQFADFADWQRQYATTAQVRKELQAWAVELAGVPPLDLPTDFNRPVAQEYEGDQVDFLIPKGTVESIEDLARETDATTFMVFLALYQVLLARHSGQEDFAIGIPASTRDRPEFEPLIGFLLNTLPVRVTYRPEESLRSLIARVRDQSLLALSRRDVPFEDIVSEMKVTRDESRSPVFQAIFAFQAEAPDLFQIGNVQVRRGDVGWRPARFDLTLDLQRLSDGSVRGLFEYSTSLFRRKTVERMLGHLLQLAEQARPRSKSPVAELDLLTPAEFQHVVFDANQTARDFDLSKCVHRMFEEQVASDPERIAISFEDQQLSYSELNARANRIAQRLRDAGVGPADVVGVAVDRTPNMVAALLAIFKVGAAYVPFDPVLPAERVAYMVEASATRFTLVEPHHRDLLLGSAATLLDLDSLVSDGPELKESVNNPNALAYVLYTSGSTGKPKGVEATQLCAVNFLRHTRIQPGMTAEDRVLALTTISFDISLVEIFLPLTVGASLVLLRGHEHLAGLKLPEILEHYDISVLQAGPMMFRNLLSTGWSGRNGLKIICTGEAFPPDLVAPLVERGDSVWNGYGPTETTVWSSVERMSKGATWVSVGKPISNCQHYVLDRQLKPVPIGVKGELYIGGTCVTRGYRGRPDLTAERFIANPFLAGGRLYKTGDISRMYEDGRFEILGRTDNQISLNGYRIEAAEVEAVLTNCSSVRESVVMIWKNAKGAKELLAYLVTDAPVDTQAIRAEAGRSLPQYMVPTRFVFLDEFPKTPNGKLDRKALPEPRLDPVGISRTAPPRTPIEATLASLFQEVLEVENVGIDDNFFDLGGNSLQTIQIIDRLNKRGIALGPAHFFRHPTIRQLAPAVGTRVADDSSEGMIVTMQEYGSAPPLFLVHSMPGDLIGYGELVHAMGQERPIFGFHGVGSYSEDVKEVTDIARFYCDKLDQFRPTGLVHLGGWCFGGTVAYEMARILRERGRRVGLVALLETYPSLSPVEEKLQRVRALFARRGDVAVDTSAILKRVLHLDRFGSAPDTDAFALEISEGPFANRASNYARNRAASERHRTQKYAGAVLLIRAAKDVSHGLLGSDYGWSRFVGGLELMSVPGVHEEVLRPPNVGPVGDFLRAQLTDADRRKS